MLGLVCLQGRDCTVSLGSGAYNDKLPWRGCSCLVKEDSLGQTTCIFKGTAPCRVRKVGKFAVRRYLLV